MDNLILVADGASDLGFTLSHTIDAVQGTAPFDAALPLRALAALYPNITQVVTLADSGIERLEDLAGRTVSSGSPNSPDGGHGGGRADERAAGRGRDAPRSGRAHELARRRAGPCAAAFTSPTTSTSCRRHRRRVRRSVKLLLDTHAALWFLSGDERLSESARRHLTDEANRVLLNAAVVWEIAVKRSLGKLVVPEEYLALMLGAGVQALPVTVDHAAAVEGLAWHHRDPFDRMLVAEAGGEGAALVSRDDRLRAYGVTLVW